MIITQLLGGLGNQLFQYAMGRAIAVKHGTVLKLDTSRFGEYKLRKYALDRFAIEAEELTFQEQQTFGIASPPKSRVQRLIGRIFDSSSIPIVSERGFTFDPSALDAPAHCRLQGYWQSPKYFASIENDIRRELTLRDPLAGPNLEVKEEISRSLAVSVHVRRGDYASNVATNLYHGTCGPDYYLAAEARIRERVSEPTFFLFSDDPDWAEANLRFRSRTVVLRHNGYERDYEDLRLMTLCRHHIIANSTFSWWGAWLADDPDKIVIAPQNWFREANQSAEDLIPKGWIRV